MFTNHINTIRSRFIGGLIAALLFALPCSLFAQDSPLTVQPSTGRVGVGTTNPVRKFEINIGAQAGDGMALADAFGHWLRLHANTGSGSFNPISGSGDFGLYFSGSGQDTGSLVIAPWSNIAKGIRVDASGNIGIATGSPAFTLHVNGEAGKPGGGSWAVASDIRLKKDVADLKGVLDKLLRLRGVSFEYQNPQAIHELPGTQLGMVAQEVERVFPQWVDESADGYKRVIFRGFEALVVEALRELREEKDAKIAALEARLEALERAAGTHAVRLTSLPE